MEEQVCKKTLEIEFTGHKTKSKPRYRHTGAARPAILESSDAKSNSKFSGLAPAGRPSKVFTRTATIGNEIIVAIMWVLLIGGLVWTVTGELAYRTVGGMVIGLAIWAIIRVQHSAPSWIITVAKELEKIERKIGGAIKGAAVGIPVGAAVGTAAGILTGDIKHGGVAGVLLGMVVGIRFGKKVDEYGMKTVATVIVASIGRAAVGLAFGVIVVKAAVFIAFGTAVGKEYWEALGALTGVGKI